MMQRDVRLSVLQQSSSCLKHTESIVSEHTVQPSLLCVNTSKDETAQAKYTALFITRTAFEEHLA